MSFIIILIIPLGVNAILSVDETEITENSATLICELPCLSSNLQCVISHFITTGSLMAYSYPTQTITLSGLNSDTTYNYCIVATNITNMMVVGDPVCDNFTTQKIIAETNEGNHILHIVLYCYSRHMHTHVFHMVIYIHTYI